LKWTPYRAGIDLPNLVQPARNLYLSVLTLGEIRKGMKGVSDVRRRTTLTDWLGVDLSTFFTGRVLGVDAAVAERWGAWQLVKAKPGDHGQPLLPHLISLFATTALHHNLSWVTRNAKDFAGIAHLTVLNSLEG
jgi:toxin FitB